MQGRSYFLIYALITLLIGVLWIAGPITLVTGIIAEVLALVPVLTAWYIRRAHGSKKLPLQTVPMRFSRDPALCRI